MIQTFNIFKIVDFIIGKY